MRLDAAETARKLPYAELVPEVARAAREFVAGGLRAPERLVVPLDHHGTLLCMPAVASDIGITKIVTVNQQNAGLGLPVIQGEVIVFDTASGRRLLMLDGPTVTARRTAAVTMLAIERLRTQRPQSALLIGTGVQAAAHVESLVQYFGVRTFWFAGRDRLATQRFSDTMSTAHAGIHATAVTASSLESQDINADVIIALTTSKTPVIPARLPDTTLAIGVGAFRPDMAELPPQLLRTRRIVVDNLAGAEREAGDLLQAHVNWSEVVELSQLLEGPPQSSPCVFKSVGHASWDLAAARVALRH